MTSSPPQGILNTGTKNKLTKKTMRTKTFLLSIREACGQIHTMIVAASTAYDAVQQVQPARVVKVANR